MGFQDEVSVALTTLGMEARVVADAIADPGGAAQALSGDLVVLRAAPELRTAAEGYAAEPAPPVWLGLTRGSREVALVPLRGGEKGVRRVVRLEIEQGLEPCCDAPSCGLQRRHTAAWLRFEGDAPPSRLLVAEQRALLPAPRGTVDAVAQRLADFLGAPLSRSEPAQGDEGDPAAALPEALGSIAPLDLARHAFRSEGDRIVLRDFASVGPRASAPRNTLIGVLLMLTAAFFWFELAMALRSDGAGAKVALLAASALFTLAGVAFLGVARFSARYRAESSPLLVLGRDRFIVTPWVSRTGAVDRRPEGRLGAAIPLGELRAVTSVRRGGRHVIELDSDHGPIDALSTDREEVARYWAAAISRAAAEVRHPSAVASARQRARARGKEETASSG
jgi:hypothetical protein